MSSGMDGAEQRKAVLFTAVVVEGGMFVLAWGLSEWLEAPTLQMIRFEWASLALGLAATAPIYLAFLASWRWPIGPARSVHELTREQFVPLFRPCTVPDLALISALAGAGEELMFRGLLQSAFILWLGAIPGLVAASLLFGALHLLSPAYGALATIAGLYFGALVLWTGDLGAAMIAHGLYDFLALLHVTRNSPGGAKDFPV
jgi:membrane protease YdiL (CAAX protease family)